MTPNDVDPVSRVKINLSVDEQVKRQYEKRIFKEWGAKRPYAGFVLEQELRALLGHGQISDLVDSVHTYADSLGEADPEEKTPLPDREETERVTYCVAEDLKDRFKREANQTDTVRYPGELLGRVMWRFAEGDGALGRAIDRIGRIGEHIQPGEDSCKQQRTAAIVARLNNGEPQMFTLGDFRDALDARASGISSSTGTPNDTEREYLSRVLDELGFVWYHSNTFADPERVDIPEHRDPTAKPYEYMSNEEKTRAVKFAALDAARSTGNGACKFTHGEAKTALAGRPNSATEWMYHVGNCRGFQFDAADGVLKINADEAIAAPENQDVVTALAGETGETAERSANVDAKGGGSTAEDTTPPGDTDAPAGDPDSDGWVTEAAEKVPEPMGDDPPAPVVDNKIARVKWPDEIEDGEISQDAVDRVTDQQRQVVLDELAAETLAEESDTAGDTDTSDEETAVRDQLDTLTSGTPAHVDVVADGGDNTADDENDTDSTGDRQVPMTGGGVATLECRSLGPNPRCPACGGQLRETDQSLTAECIRARCGQRVSLTEVVDALVDGTTGASSTDTVGGGRCD